MKELQSYGKEIETQSKKPIEDQILDLKYAGAKLLQTIDNLIPLVDNVVEALERESKKDLSDWTNNINPPIDSTNEQQSTPKEGQQSNTNRVDPW